MRQQAYWGRSCFKFQGAPHSCSLMMPTLFNNPFGPAWLLRGWGWRGRGWVLVMSVWALCCPVHSQSETGVPAPQHQAICVYLHKYKPLKLQVNKKEINNLVWGQNVCLPFHWVWTRWTCSHRIPDWEQKARQGRLIYHRPLTRRYSYKENIHYMAFFVNN